MKRLFPFLLVGSYLYAADDKAEAAVVLAAPSRRTAWYAFQPKLPNGKAIQRGYVMVKPKPKPIDTTATDDQKVLTAGKESFEALDIEVGALSARPPKHKGAAKGRPQTAQTAAAAEKLSKAVQS